MPMRYWLMKSEPDVYSLENLKRDKTAHWDGVRNYQARNFMRDDMKKGDLVLFYHSNADPSGVAGVARVSRESYPDFTAMDKKSDYFDSKATKENPRWFMVDIEFVATFPHFIPLETLKKQRELKEMLVVQKGARLSVQPVERQHFEVVKRMGGMG